MTMTRRRASAGFAPGSTRHAARCIDVAPNVRHGDGTGRHTVVRGQRSREDVMLTTFNNRWQRHDGFGFLAVAFVIAAAMAVGYLTATF